jgi:hypothetical protein
MSFLVGFHRNNRMRGNPAKEAEEFTEIHLPMAQRKVVIPGSIVIVQMNFGDMFAQEIEPLG